MGSRLAEAGINVRVIDKGGDFGGTWYWNRYPGAQCDTASMVYLPLLEETGHMPTEKYVHGPEIQAHCRRIGEKFGLYEDALFHTEVTSLTWDQAQAALDRRDRPRRPADGAVRRARHRPAERAEAPRDPWDHLVRRSLVPHLKVGLRLHRRRPRPGADGRSWPASESASSAPAPPRSSACRTWQRPRAELYVFQRTPSSVDVRANHPIDPEWFAEIATPGWQQRWLENFTAKSRRRHGK